MQNVEIGVVSGG